MHVIILGAGPSGLTTALSLSKLSTPPTKITLLELRPQPATIGGTINLTPLAMRYLDSLGPLVSDHIRGSGVSLDHGLDYISARTGGRLGNIWGGIGGFRVRRGCVVEGLLRGAVEEEKKKGKIEIRWGVKVTRIDGGGGGKTETGKGGGGVKLWFHDDSKNDDTTGKTPLLPTLEGDVLIGCDGIHSSARKLWVQPEGERKPVYTGRAVVMGFVDKEEEEEEDQEQSQKSPLRLSDGKGGRNTTPALVDTALISSPKTGEVLLASYYEPSRKGIYLAQVAYMDEPAGGGGGGGKKEDDARDGWKLKGGDEVALKRGIMECYDDDNNKDRNGGGGGGGGGEKIKGLLRLLERCESWHLYPCYVLPGEGRWYRDNVLLLGDAAHAMPPQGESTGLAIEDGILLAHVFSRWQTGRSVAQMFADFETLRKPVIDKYYSDSLWAMKYGFVKSSSWVMTVVREWGIWVYLLITRWRQNDHFAGDVRELELPA